MYEPIKDYEELSDRLKAYQMQYNENVRGGKMDLVFFKVTGWCNFRTFLFIPFLLVIIISLAACIITRDKD